MPEEKRKAVCKGPQLANAESRDLKAGHRN
jgi:hypothetical protein